MNTKPSTNFACLTHRDARHIALAAHPWEVYASDPPTSIAKRRLFVLQVLEKRAQATVGLLPLCDETQQSLVGRPLETSVIRPTQRTILRDLRQAGEAAAQENRSEANEALHRLRMSRDFAIRCQRGFGNDREFDLRPLLPPPPPKRTRRSSRLRPSDLDAENGAKEGLTAYPRAIAREDGAIWKAFAAEQAQVSDRSAESLARANKRVLEASTRAMAAYDGGEAKAGATELHGWSPQLSEGPHPPRADDTWL